MSCFQSLANAANAASFDANQVGLMGSIPGTYAPPPAIVSSPSTSTTNSDGTVSDAPSASPAVDHQSTLGMRSLKRQPSSPLDALAMACEAETQQIQPSLASSTQEGINTNDVLCGRGGLTNHHSGNVRFRQLVRLHQHRYLKATKREKAGVAREIVEIIRNLSPSGRFLKKDPKNPGIWIEIGDRKAREKTSQALREGAPELRQEIQTAGGLDAPILAASTDEHILLQLPRGNTPNTKPESLVSNRARVVSDDSPTAAATAMMGIRPIFDNQQQQQPAENSATARAFFSPTSYQDQLQQYTEQHLHISQQQKPAVTVPAIVEQDMPNAESKPNDSVLQAEVQRRLKLYSMAGSAGSKRKVTEEGQQKPAKKRGPRLKLFKSRVDAIA